MEREILIEKAKEILSTISTDTSTPEANRLDVIIPPEKLLEAVTAIKSSHWGYLAAITGLDHAPSALNANEEKEWNRTGEDYQESTTGLAYAGSLEALYHFCNMDVVLTLRVQLPHSGASVPAIDKLLPSASLFERELKEMFGINIVGATNQDHLLLPDDWPANVYPLRKEFTGLGSSTEEKGE